ncbi:UNVERIFIED_CONTAM: protein terminal ear1 [Sesamum radiatum]|uniref:Protein terminal ear1 n=1 Tax=Sesamum radiatum TaxID=300843 RepID=A0AAW2M3Y3_SESRA
MCIKLPRTLNPKAQEWRPSALQPPFQPHSHLIYPPHSQPPVVPLPEQQLVQVVPFTSGPPQNVLCQLPHQQPYYQSHALPSYQAFIPFNVHAQHHSFHCVSFPADESFYNKETKDLGCGNEINLQEENTDESYNKEKMVESAPKRAPVDVVKKGLRRALPPRLQRALRSTFSVDKKPRLVKKEWRPRKPANPESHEGSGDAGASLSPLPASGDDSSHPSKTTVMIKNIPNQLGRDFMLKFLDDCCKSYSLEYDFLYLPMDFRKKGNLGYAFVNFTSAVAALGFSKTLHNYKWETALTDRGPITSKKICEVTWARIQVYSFRVRLRYACKMNSAIRPSRGRSRQWLSDARVSGWNRCFSFGKEALIRRFKNSSFCCDRIDFLPVVLDPPRNGSDPNPCAPVVLGKLNWPDARSKTY